MLIFVIAFFHTIVGSGVAVYFWEEVLDDYVKTREEKLFVAYSLVFAWSLLGLVTPLWHRASSSWRSSVRARRASAARSSATSDHTRRYRAKEGVAMIYRTLLVFGLASCRNDAITYAHLLVPEARCTAINTEPTKSGEDTAVCAVGREIWACTTRGYMPSCVKNADIPLEAVK